MEESEKPATQETQPLSQEVVQFYTQQAATCMHTVRDLRIRVFMLTLDKAVAPLVAKFISDEAMGIISSLSESLPKEEVK